MKTKIVDLWSIVNDDVIYSTYDKTTKKWKKNLNDINNISINIYGLKVERSLNSNDNWILCLYNSN
jgi:hypothetical protein